MPAIRPPAAPPTPLPGFARSSLTCAFALVLSTSASLALAQSPAMQAANPATPVTVAPGPVAPAAAPDTAIELPTDIERARALWRRANERVAEFPRGHADLLRLETAQGAAPTAPATSASATLDMAQALRQSLRLRPDLFVRAGMNEPERARVQLAYVAHVREVQRAWVQAVAARQSLRLMGESLEATSTGVELGRRMVQAGNWSQARLMREQLIEAGARQAWVSARQAQVAADATLAGLLGHWDGAAAAQALAALPAQLPGLPAEPSPGPGIQPTEVEAAVLRSHPTLAWQRLEVQRQRQMAGLSSGRREEWSRALDAALQAPATTPWQAPEITDLRLLRDHALERAVNAETALLAAASARRSMARSAWDNLQAQHASAKHAQDGVLRLQTALSQETQLRYNGMLQSTWELLAQARERMGAMDAAAQAQRDFWLAQTDWQALLAGGDYEAPNVSGGRRNGAGAAPAGH
jgi:hypothetical protein